MTVYASLNFGSKTQQTFGSQTERTSSYSGPNTSPGAFILPSYPLSSPRTSPKHTSPLTVSPKKSQDNSVNFSSSWPLKSFEGLSKPSPQRKLVNPKSSDPTGKMIKFNKYVFVSMNTLELVYRLINSF